ncbi:MAG TPA: hypothetical protein VGL58_10560 [Caulobacteraceae bacterium]|jgi:hypothetical protein
MERANGRTRQLLARGLGVAVLLMASSACGAGMPGNSSMILGVWKTTNGCEIDGLTFTAKTMTLHDAAYGGTPATQTTAPVDSFSWSPPNTVIVTAGVGEVAYIFTDHDHMTSGENNCTYQRAG